LPSQLLVLAMMGHLFLPWWLFGHWCLPSQLLVLAVTIIDSCHHSHWFLPSQLLVLAIAVVGSCHCSCWFLLLWLLVLAVTVIGSFPHSHWFLPLQLLVLAIAMIGSCHHRCWYSHQVIFWSAVIDYHSGYWFFCCCSWLGHCCYCCCCWLTVLSLVGWLLWSLVLAIAVGNCLACNPIYLKCKYEKIADCHLLSWYHLNRSFSLCFIFMTFFMMFLIFYAFHFTSVSVIISCIFPPCVSFDPTFFLVHSNLFNSMLPVFGTLVSNFYLPLSLGLLCGLLITFNSKYMIT